MAFFDSLKDRMRGSGKSGSVGSRKPTLEQLESRRVLAASVEWVNLFNELRVVDEVGQANDITIKSVGGFVEIKDGGIEIEDPNNPNIAANTVERIEIDLKEGDDEADLSGVNSSAFSALNTVVAGDIRVALGDGEDTYVGSPLPDSVHGGRDLDDDTDIEGDGGDTIDGNGGDDVILGGDGNDTLDGGDDDDSISGDGANDTIYGRDGSDRLHGGIGHDDIFGGLGNDELWGFTGNDQLHGGDNADFIDAGAGNDSAYGEGGDDRIYGRAGNDILSGGSGDDTLIDTWGLREEEVEDSDKLDGGSGDDRLEAGDNDPLDTLNGGGGFDEGEADRIGIDGDRDDMDDNIEVQLWHWLV